jgi:hypothetical protein
MHQIVALLPDAVDFLGHWVDSASISPLDRHIMVVPNFAIPSDIKQLQQFLGLLKFYCCFLPSIAGVLGPLTYSLCSDAKEIISPSTDHRF